MENFDIEQNEVFTNTIGYLQKFHIYSLETFKKEKNK